MSTFIKAKYFWIFGLILLVWLIEIVNMKTGYRFNEWAIKPRSLRGLLGIPVSPFLHDGVGHLLSNTLPFAILGSIVMMRNSKNFLYVSLLVVFLGGVLIWIMGRSSYHLGASVLIFGYFGYLVAAGWYQRTLSSIAIAVLVFIIYGGSLGGLLPVDMHVSWEGHLFGCLSGILGAWLLHRQPYKKTKTKSGI
ncbi:rhomboid family intramembrane serine protease [Dehalococcoidia bacterium]|nr:rhomboid family intramembrane serine protease [Dehalococcoidia bacterium]